MLGKARLGPVIGIEFFSDSFHLTLLESADLYQSPAFGGVDHGAEHELKEGPFAEGVGEDLEAPPLLDKEAL